MFQFVYGNINILIRPIHNMDEAYASSWKEIVSKGVCDPGIKTNPWDLITDSLKCVQLAGY